MEIYTIGYHGFTLNGLIRKLDSNDIKLLVDIRTKPYSHYSAHFNRENLQRVLGSRYVWKGNCLGGMTGKRQPGYDACLNWIVRVSRVQNVCVMCMEADPHKCHRSIWIGNDLYDRFKIDVIHIVKSTFKTGKL